MSSLMPGVSPIATLLAQAKAAPDARLSLCDLSLQPRFGCKFFAHRRGSRASAVEPFNTPVWRAQTLRIEPSTWPTTLS